MFEDFEKILEHGEPDVNWSEVGIFSAVQVLEQFDVADWDKLRSHVLVADRKWRTLCIEALSALGTAAALTFLFYILYRNDGDTIQECLETIRVTVEFSDLDQEKKKRVTCLANAVSRNPREYTEDDLSMEKLPLIIDGNVDHRSEP